MKKTKSIDPRELEIGDIFLTTSKFSLFSIIIRLFTWSRYSHAAIYVGRDTIVEAVAKGVRVYNIHRWSEGLNGRCIILRSRNRRVAMIAAQQCEIFHGARYSVWDAVLSGIAAYFMISFPLKLKNTHMFCSRLIAQAFSMNGYEISNKHFQIVRPKDLEKSDKLLKVEPKYIDTPKYEKINSIMQFEVVTIELIKSVIAFMKGYKIKYNGIVSVAGIMDIAGTYKDLNGFDKGLSEIVKTSKFYVQWQVEKNNNPENWDAICFWQLANTDKNLAEIEIRARLKIHQEKIMQFTSEIRAFKNSALYKGETYKVFLDLRKTLLEESQNAYNGFRSALVFIENDA